MEKQRPKATLTLATKESISPEMVRLWFRPDEQADFTRHNEGDYLKLMFSSNTEQPVLRTFTVARVNRDENQIAIDFVLHEDDASEPSLEQGGFAHYYAHTASPGDSLNIFGPNRKKSILPAYNNTVFVADPTAIPALESVLRHATTSGHIIAYQCSAALLEQLRQFHLDVSAADSITTLEERLKTLSNRSFSEVWCAGEYQMMRTVRKHLTADGLIARENQYFSSYWKSGMTEDGHKAFKRTNSL